MSKIQQPLPSDQSEPRKRRPPAGSMEDLAAGRKSPTELRESMVHRFIGAYVPDISTGCWNWKSVHRLGYGIFSTVVGRWVPAHRGSWILLIGNIPVGLCVCHRCDNRRCVNPNHLFLGTHQDNSNDCVSKGRIARWNRMPQTKLTPEIVRNIRTSKEPSRRLARFYGVSQSAIRWARMRKNWTWVK